MVPCNAAYSTRRIQHKVERVLYALKRHGTAAYNTSLSVRVIVYESDTFFGTKFGLIVSNIFLRCHMPTMIAVWD